MALVVKDRVKETTSTTGTSTLTLGGAVAGFQTFTSVLSNGDTTYYAIFESSTGQFEVGLGTFTSSGTTLARTTVLESSNSGNAINLTAGAADVFITQPAEKAVYLDASGYIATSDGRNVTNVAASTAATLATARNIGGVSFDGSANINLPGVNTSGNQDTSGNAATATTATNADTVDSLHASSFLRSDAADSASGTITVATGTSPAIIAKSDDWGEQLEILRNHAVNWPSVKFSNTSGEVGKVFVDTSNNNLMYVKGSTSNYETVWTSLTDGSGSGLDADLLDGVEGSSYLRSDQADTINGNLTIGGTAHIAMQENHFINRRFEMDGGDNSAPVYILLCLNAASNDVNGTITMDRTSGLRHACSWNMIVTSGSSTTPLGSLMGHSVAHNGQPSARLVTLTYSSVSYVALEITNPDLYHETTGAYFNGRIVNSGSNTLTALPSSSVSSVSALSQGNSKAIIGDTLEVGNDIKLPDSGKALFGTGSDLEIYHDGSNSYIDDAGTGNLNIRASANVAIDKYTGEAMARFYQDAGVFLYYNNAAKFETTSTGINVTGTAEVDTLTFSDGSSQTSAGASTGKAIAMAIVFG